MSSLSAPRPRSSLAPPALLLRHASDERLTRLATSGSEAAIAAIFERHHQALHRYCYSILGNGHDAADALQNTMIKALRALPGESRRIVLRPWLYRVAHNESISLLRARRPDAGLDAAAHVGDEAAAGLLESRERLRTLTSDLGELTERQRGALLMRELGGLEFAEVADALGTTASAAKQSVYEARCALQAMEEGRAMDCDAIRRAISDGDRRTLRGARVRGHLRACSGCHDFQAALERRPAELAAVIPPLPIAMAAAMLHGAIGAGGAGGGGLTIGLAGTAKTATGLSLASKAAAIVAVTATLGGGAVYVAPGRDPAAADRPAARRAPEHRPGVPAAATPVVSAGPAADSSTTGAPRAGTAGAITPASSASAAPPSTARGKPASTPGARPATRPGRSAAGAAAGRRAKAQPGRRASAASGRRPATRPARKLVTPGRAPSRAAPEPGSTPAAPVASAPSAGPAAPVTPAVRPDGSAPAAAAAPGAAAPGADRP